MKILIVEDDYSSRKLLQKYLQNQGEISIADDGERAVSAFREALDSHQPFDLVCLDIMLPRLDGQAVLREMRALEESVGISGWKASKVIMLTALSDAANVLQAFRGQCESYLRKPITKERLFREIASLGLPGTKNA